MAKTKVMIVGEDKEFLEELGYLLSLADYDSVTVVDTNVAVQKATSAKPDVLLLDIKRPGEKGFQVARELERFSQTADIPIIAITAFCGEEERSVVAASASIRTCLSKPFQPLDVIAQIERVKRGSAA
jgi:two-component system phosphate regulon response regulator PhoB